MQTQHPNMHSLMPSIGSALHRWHETERREIKAADWTWKLGVERTHTHTHRWREEYDSS